MFYYQSGVAYISYDFTQLLTLLTLASLLMLIILADLKNENYNKVRVKIIACLLFSGVFTDLAFLTKQSNGLMILISSGIAASYLVYFSYRNNLKLFFYYMAGVFIPFFIIFIWLISENSLGHFLIKYLLML